MKSSLRVPLLGVFVAAAIAVTLTGCCTTGRKAVMQASPVTAGEHEQVTIQDDTAMYVTVEAARMDEMLVDAGFWQEFWAADAVTAAVEQRPQSPPDDRRRYEQTAAKMLVLYGFGRDDVRSLLLDDNPSDVMLTSLDRVIDNIKTKTPTDHYLRRSRL